MAGGGSVGAQPVSAPVPVVPCPVLVGRAAEAALLEDALTAACAGRGAMVFVAGEAGIGKSRLVHEVAAAARHRGAIVLRGRAVPGSGGAAFRPLAEALAPLVAGELDGELAPWLPVLAAIVPTASPAGAVDVTPPVRGEAVLRLLQASCATSGGLLVLEDLHWADPETLAVVEHLSDHLERVPVLGVVTVRSDEPSGALELARRVAAGRTARVLELQRLNDAQVRAMVHSCTGGSAAVAMERIVALADGVPFLVEETLVSPGLPASFAESVRGRLAQLAERDRHVLVTAAAFGRHFDWRLLPPATALPESEVIDALDRAVAMQLLAVDGDGFRFRHALTAEAVFGSVIPPRREQHAAAALAALDAAHGKLTAELRATAAQVAERAGQRERAGTLHAAAGEDALARGALHTAVVALDRAADLLTPGEARDRASERLVDALVLAGRVDDALAAGDELVRRLPPERAGAVRLQLARAATTAARWGVAGEHLAAARDIVDRAGSPSLRADVAIQDAEVALGTNDPARAEQLAQDALALARAEGLAEHECAALQLLGRRARRSSLTDAEQWFREALAVAEAHGLAVWRLRALHELGTIALLDRSEVDALLEAQRQAEQLGAMATVAILDIEIAAGYAGLDDYDGQLRHGEQAARRGRELGLDLITAYGWHHVAVACALRREDERAAAAVDAALAAAPGNRDIEGLLAGMRVFRALVDDRLDDALVHAEEMTALLRGSTTAPPAHSRAAWPLLLALAHRPEAEPAAAELGGLRVTGAGRGWLTMTRAVLTGRHDPDLAATLAVDADAETVHYPVWQALGRRIAAEAATADGWAIPDGWLAEAEVCLRRRGHLAAAASCRRLRGAVPDAVTPTLAGMGITRREADVLALVADGCSNREIAERLYLSVRTVEKHVESLLRKTGTKSRTQLARLTATT